jgi:hypothetical protein
VRLEVTQLSGGPGKMVNVGVLKVKSLPQEVPKAEH